MSEQIIDVPLQDVQPHPDNVRETIDGNLLKQLISSIKASGIHNPLLVRPHPEQDGQAAPQYQIIAGHRRRQAAIKAGLDTVPVIVRDLDDDQAYEAMLIENLQRVDLTPLEEARGYFRLIERGMTQKDLASRVGRSQKHVSTRLKILSLPRPIMELVGDRIAISDVDEWAEFFEGPVWTAATEDEDVDAAEVLDKYLSEYDRVSVSAFTRKVASLLDALAAQRKVAKIREKAEASGVEVIEQEFKSNRYEWGWPSGVAPLEDLQIAEADHKDQPCHAIGLAKVRDGSGGPTLTRVWVCSKKSRHTAKNAPAEAPRPDNWDEIVAEREQKKAERARLKAEREHMTEVGQHMLRKPKTTLVADILAAQVLASHHSADEVKAACRLLDIDTTGMSAGDASDALNALAAKSPAQARRAGLALACSGIPNISVDALNDELDPVAYDDETWNPAARVRNVLVLDAVQQAAKDADLQTMPDPE